MHARGFENQQVTSNTPTKGEAKTTRGKSIKSAAKTKNYEEGKQLLSPQKTSGRGSGFGVLTTLIEGLTAKAKAGAATLEAESGKFVDASVNLDIDIPNVPGLSLSIQGEVTYELYGSGKQFLHVRSVVGVKYGLGKFFNVNAGMLQCLELTGDNLGAAFVDAVKQCAYMVLERAGVHGQFRDLVRLAKEGPSFWDYAKTLIPIYGSYEAAKIAIARFGANNIEAAYKAFVAFFKNDETVAFDASVGLQAGAGAEVKNIEGGITLAASMGVQDVEGKEARAYGEISGEGQISKGNNSALIRVSKRWLSSKDTVVCLSFSGTFSYSKRLDPKKRGLEILSGLLGGHAFRLTMDQIAATGQSGGKLSSVTQMAALFIDLAAASGVKGELAENLAGIDFALERRNGRFESVSARIKSGIGTSFDIAKAEVSAMTGSFFDVSADVQKFLAATAGGR